MKTSIYLIVIILMMLCLNVCDQLIDVGRGDLTISPELIVIKGYNEFTDTMVISAGTIVRFEHQYMGNIGCGGEGSPYIRGTLDLQNGGKLIAQGTADNPIIFETDESGGSLEFREDASDDSILEYCELEHVHIEISNSTMLQRCRLSYIEIDGMFSEATIQYNTLDGYMKIGAFSHFDTPPTPRVYYNNISSASSSGIFLCHGNPDIRNNNITNTSGEAVRYYVDQHTENKSFTIYSNYIKDCNGQIGVDTTGSQSSSNVIYVNPRTEPVTEAGCGW